MGDLVDEVVRLVSQSADEFHADLEAAQAGEAPIPTIEEVVIVLVKMHNDRSNALVLLASRIEALEGSADSTDADGTQGDRG